MNKWKKFIGWIMFNWNKIVLGWIMVFIIFLIVVAIPNWFPGKKTAAGLIPVATDVACVIKTGLSPINLDFASTINIYIEGEKGNYDLEIEGTTLTLKNDEGKVLWVHKIEGEDDE